MPADHGMLLDSEFDFVSHEVVCRTSTGESRKIALRPVSVAQFFEEFTRTLSSLVIKENLAQIDKLGTSDTYGHYPTGWAVAFSTPFKMFKRYSEYAGGTCDHRRHFIFRHNRLHLSGI